MPIIDGVTGVVNKVIDHFWPASMSEEEKAKAKLEASLMTQRLALEDKSAFRNFVLDYEGRAKDIPKTLVWLRSRHLGWWLAQDWCPWLSLCLLRD